MTDMTNRPLEIDQALEDWLGGGPRLSADQVVGRALTDVGATGQDRVSLFAIDVTVFRLGLVAAAVAALAIGLGLGIGPRLVGTEPSQASPTQEPSGPPSGSVLYTNKEDGYELTLPASWTPREMFSFDDPFGTMRFGAAYSFGGGSPFGALTVSIGSPDGTVNVCAPMLCHQIVATTLDDLDDAVAGRAVGSGPMTETAVELTLDGEPARLERIEFGEGLILGGPQFHHLFAFHEGRPIMLSFDVYAYGVGREAVNDIGWVYALIDGFRFLDDSAEPSPMPTPTPSGRPFKAFPILAAGFAVDLPETWQLRSSSDSGVLIISGPEGGLRIRVSDESQEIATCLGLARCQPVAASTIADLIAVVRGEYRSRWGITMAPTISQQRVTLDGAEATRVTVSPPQGMTGPGTSHFVLVMRDGRAIIVEWMTTLSGIGIWNEILASFQFLD